MSTTNSETASAAFTLRSVAPPLAELDHRAVLEFTQQLFGYAPSVCLDVDPETSEQCFVVTAPATGSVEEIVALNDRWHRSLRGVAGDLADQYRLSIHPQ